MSLSRLLSTVPFSDGIFNCGNTCFINAILQMLFRIPELSQLNIYVINQISNDESNINLKFLLRFYRLVDKYFRNNVSSQTMNDYESFLHEFYNISQRSQWPFVRNEQCDAHEFLLAFVDIVEEAINFLNENTRSYQSLNDFATTTTNTIENMYCNIQQTIECEYGHTSNTYRNEILSLKVQNMHDINASIYNYFDNIIFNGTNKFNCDACNRQVNAIQKLTLDSLPKFLILHFMLFALNPKTKQVRKMQHYYFYDVCFPLKYAYI